MANLLLSDAGWVLSNATFVNGVWSLNAGGVFSTSGRGDCDVSSKAGDTLQATCSYNLDNFNNDDQGPRDIWFIVTLSGAVVFSKQLADGGVTVQPASGTFDLDLELAGGTVHMMVAGDSTGEFINGYNEYGSVALAQPEPPPERYIQLRYSNDGGNNYSDWRNLESGDTGDFLRPLVARRLGMARHRIWEIMDTSNAAQDVLAASIIVESE